MTEKNRHIDEMLTDNTKLDKCAQCEKCILNNDGTVWSNNFRKGCCLAYPYPSFKPIGVIRNETNCQYRKVVELDGR